MDSWHWQLSSQHPEVAAPKCSNKKPGKNTKPAIASLASLAFMWASTMSMEGTCFRFYMVLINHWTPPKNMVFVYVIFNLTLLFMQFIPGAAWLPKSAALLTSKGLPFHLALQDKALDTATLLGEGPENPRHSRDLENQGIHVKGFNHMIWKHVRLVRHVFFSDLLIIENVLT